ncbi:hypothetical protein J4Q44_G00372230 [Coregonus suidteri]|uniref:Uncharacterized protein n=1 Tax=Coregonus suidteri TaxID=861788 RepID=A0AAN8Q5U1_9TELE
MMMSDPRLARASPGVGGAKKLRKPRSTFYESVQTWTHTKKTGNLGETKKEPHKKIDTAEEKKEDPFGDVIKGNHDCHPHPC